MNTDRIKSHFSDAIDLKKYKQESRRYILFGFVIAILFHGLLGIYFKFERTAPQSKAVKSIPVKFITQPPRNTQSYEISIRKPVQKKLERIHPGPGVLPQNNYLQPFNHLDQQTSVKTKEYTPEILIPDEPERSQHFGFISGEKDIARIPDRHRAFKDEWISIDDLDTGQYKALVVHDPNDKTNIKGYVHIPVGIWGTDFKPAINLRSAIINLNEGFYRYTGITLIIDKAVHLTSPELLKYPFIYITADDLFETPPFEATIFKNILKTEVLHSLNRIQNRIQGGRVQERII